MRVWRADYEAVALATMGALVNATDENGLKGGGRLPNDVELKHAVLGMLTSLAQDTVTIPD